jgi:uncharacterized protein (DUF2147 family)
LNDVIIGVWHVPGQNATVQVYRVDSTYFGKLVVPRAAGAHPADSGALPAYKLPKGRGRADTLVLTGIEYIDDRVWGRGKVYDLQKGRHRRCKITVVAFPDKIGIVRYTLIPWFGTRETWTRVKAK